MNRNERLQAMLREWRDIPHPSHPPEALAGDILSFVEQITSSTEANSLPRETWHSFLNTTASSLFLLALEKPGQRDRWAEIAFSVIRRSGYSLRDMFTYRVSTHPDKILFKDMSPGKRAEWTYAQAADRIRETAAVFYDIAEVKPRVAIIAENCLEAAVSDLACLLHGILNTPLSPHLDDDTTAGIITGLGINIVVTDTLERCRRFSELRRRYDLDFVLLGINREAVEGFPETEFLDARRMRLNPNTSKTLLRREPTPLLNRIVTVMYTSGSTGDPKGVCFSGYNLITKRFARAAALPGIGGDEIWICYLPLFHTFGRYLEMLGLIFWGGTYVFPGNPSAETLFELLPLINPTGFVSIPLRWAQLHERCLDHMEPVPDPEHRKTALRSIIGSRLRWGLSAAGRLDPGVFRFFQQAGVNLCSGFGMTEATGGITMTIPGRYRDDSTGLPLPGIQTILSPEGELKISGPYVARYLENTPLEDAIPFPGRGKKRVWLSTGDLFRVDPDGHFFIVDRIKDIYKNNKGQTIAPRKVETLFAGVPGIKRAFLVGDGRAYKTSRIPIPARMQPITSNGPGLNSAYSGTGRLSR